MKKLYKSVILSILLILCLSSNLFSSNCFSLGYDGVYLNSLNESLYCYNDVENNNVEIFNERYLSTKKMDVFGPFTSLSSSVTSPVIEEYYVTLDKNGNRLITEPSFDSNFTLEQRVLFKTKDHSKNVTTEADFDIYSYMEIQGDAFDLFSEFKGKLRFIKTNSSNEEILKMESRGDYITSIKINNEFKIGGFLKFPFLLTVNKDGQVFKYVGEFYDEVDNNLTSLDIENLNNELSSKLIKVEGESSNGELILADTYSAEIKMKSNNTVEIYGFDSDNNKVLLSELVFD